MTHFDPPSAGNDARTRAGAISARLGTDAQANVDDILRALGAAAGAQAPPPTVFSERWTGMVARTRDTRTGLLAPEYLWERLVHALGRHCRYGTEFALLHVGSDDAEERHAAEVARTLSRSLRGTDAVAALGRGEFAALLDTLRAPADGRQVAERLLGALEGAHAELSFRIGVARLHPHGVEPEAVLWQAATAMRRARGPGGAPVEVAAA